MQNSESGPVGVVRSRSDSESQARARAAGGPACQWDRDGSAASGNCKDLSSPARLRYAAGDSESDPAGGMIRVLIRVVWLRDSAPAKVILFTGKLKMKHF